MSNTLTGLIPMLYDALDIVSRELVGFIGAVGRDSRADSVALNQVVRVPIVPTATTNDIVPGPQPQNDGDVNVDFVDLTIRKSKYSPVRWSGEEELALKAGGQRAKIVLDQYAQAMRALVNEVEADVADCAFKNASRAYGTAGTTPFASAHGDLAQVLKILKDNGCPETDLQCILNTASGANMRSLTNLTKANEAGTDATLRRGTLLQLYGFDIRESGQIKAVTKGAGSGYLVNNAAGYPVGATKIAVDTGTGAINKGDIVTFAGDSNKYVVASLSGGLLTIQSPGLLQPVADNATITVGNNYTPNICFNRQAIQLATRAPAMPEGGDSAKDVFTLTDPISGLSFQIALYSEYRRSRVEVGLAWGCDAIKSAHIATLLG